MEVFGTRRESCIIWVLRTAWLTPGMRKQRGREQGTVQGFVKRSRFTSRHQYGATESLSVTEPPSAQSASVEQSLRHADRQALNLLLHTP